MGITTESWQHQDIMTNTIRMHYVTQGSGPLIVLLHGFPEFWYSWRLQIPFLAELGYTVVAPDLRGYNDSDKPTHGYDIPNLLRDIVGLIKGLGYEKAIIVGHDWGGVLAWNFAIAYPQMTERLIVLNAPHPGAFQRELRTPKQLRKSWYVFAFQLPWLPEYILGRNHAEAIGRMFRDTAVQKAAFPPEVLAHYQEAMSKPRALTSSINYYRAIFNNPQTILDSRANTAITMPTLLIWGEQDIALDISLTEALDQWVKNLQVKRIRDSGHWVQQEQPELVNRFLKEFLQPA
ncbi:alpha/beta fold hydrolase [Dictyobacter kobayashii]|uniref:Epoxide hydrolase n=1 Tax=Dictyobacter kobayashii TaxID=2014872 RepID=A0A402AIT3_9CHLR|nr:alpha/beta hydrolase [Dictyobacter kobayashii]GCE19027.1 epoxide hydrolase [Dictyobacter kobayashii]